MASPLAESVVEDEVRDIIWPVWLPDVVILNISPVVSALSTTSMTFFVWAIESILNDEFAGSIPVYTGDFKDMGSQSIRLNPVGSDLVERMTTAELREYIVDVSYTFKEKMVKKDIQNLNFIKW